MGKSWAKANASKHLTPGNSPSKENYPTHSRLRPRVTAPSVTTQELSTSSIIKTIDLSKHHHGFHHYLNYHSRPPSLPSATQHWHQSQPTPQSLFENPLSPSRRKATQPSLSTRRRAAPSESTYNLVFQRPSAYASTPAFHNRRRGIIEFDIPSEDSPSALVPGPLYAPDTPVEGHAGYGTIHATEGLGLDERGAPVYENGAPARLYACAVFLRDGPVLALRTALRKEDGSAPEGCGAVTPKIPPRTLGLPAMRSFASASPAA